LKGSPDFKKAHLLIRTPFKHLVLTAGEFVKSDVIGGGRGREL
jgi:hypothetical protein